jgi:hypothetical protein
LTKSQELERVALPEPYNEKDCGSKLSQYKDYGPWPGDLEERITRESGYDDQNGEESETAQDVVNNPIIPCGCEPESVMGCNLHSWGGKKAVQGAVKANRYCGKYRTEPRIGHDDDIRKHPRLFSPQFFQSGSGWPHGEPRQNGDVDRGSEAPRACRADDKGLEGC